MMVRSRGGADPVGVGVQTPWDADPEAVETLREWKPHRGGDPVVRAQTP